MRLFPIQDNGQYPLRSMVTPSSSAVITLPYSVKRGREREQLEKLFDVEYKTFSDLLSVASDCVIVKQKSVGQDLKISALIAAWSVESLIQSSATDLCSRFFSKLLKSTNMSEKYSFVIKIFSSSLTLLDDNIFFPILDSLKQAEDDKDAIIVISEKNESLVRFLRIRKYEELKTDFLMSGQELMCKSSKNS